MTRTALLLLVALGCGNERWVEAEVAIPPGVGAVCLSARGPSGVVFRERYAAGEIPGTVVFVEGDDVSGRVILEATHRRGGREVARARVDAAFDTGALPVLLRAGDCQPFAPVAAELGSVVGGEALVAFDGSNGVDTIVVDVGAEGRTLDGTVHPFQALIGEADLDGDCEPELWGRADGEARTAGRAIPIDVGAVAFGDAGTGPRLFVAGATGVSVVSPEGVSRMLSGAPSRAVVVGDLNGDGVDEVVVGGDSGIEVFFGGEGGPAIAPGATPRGWTALELALGDFDGDGDLDLAVARGDGLGIARNRGDGFLEAIAAPTVAPTILRAGDVDGDCVDDVVAVGGAGGASQWIRGGDLVANALGGDVIDATFARVVDGPPQLVVLRADGRVEGVAP